MIKKCTECGKEYEATGKLNRMFTQDFPCDECCKKIKDIERIHKKILRHKPETRKTINEIYDLISVDDAIKMLDEINVFKNKTTEIILEYLNDPKYDHWFFYNAGVSYNSEVRTICNKYRINHLKSLEEKRIDDLGGPF